MCVEHIQLGPVDNNKKMHSSKNTNTIYQVEFSSKQPIYDILFKRSNLNNCRTRDRLLDPPDLPVSYRSNGTISLAYPMMLLIL